MPEAYGIRIIDIEGAEDRQQQVYAEVQHASICARINRAMVAHAQEVCSSRTGRCIYCGQLLRATDEYQCLACMDWPESIGESSIHCTECGRSEAVECDVANCANGFIDDNGALCSTCHGTGVCPCC